MSQVEVRKHISLKQCATVVNRADKTIREQAREAGLALIAAKEQLKHGEFMPWLAENCTVSQQTANEWMAFARGDVKDLHGHRDQNGGRHHFEEPDEYEDEELEGELPDGRKMYVPREKSAAIQYAEFVLKVDEMHRVLLKHKKNKEMLELIRAHVPDLEKFVKLAKEIS